MDYVAIIVQGCNNLLSELILTSTVNCRAES